MTTRAGLTCVMLVAGWASAASAQSETTAEATDDHSIVYELGWASDWSPDEGFHPRGVTLAFEVTPVEGWLEVEVGVSAIRSEGVTEIPVDVLFKKPWRFSPQFEFMIGVGPELIHASGPEHATYAGLSGVLDFMFWSRRNVGWYVEPGYEMAFPRDGTHRGIGIAAGLLIGR